eukprot:1745742-Pleurochrysis_carterae.AAC.1
MRRRPCGVSPKSELASWSQSVFIQVGDMGSKFTNGVSESLMVQMGCSSLVAFRRVGTRRTTRHAEAGRGGRRVLSRR